MMSKGLFSAIARVLIVAVRPLLRRLFRLQVRGLDQLDVSRPAVYVPNHVSLLDAVLLAVLLPPEVAFVVNTKIARRFSWALRFRAHIAVDPLNPYSVRNMLKTVLQGTPLVVFPEGRITTTGGMMKVYGGIGYIALRSQAPLIPVAIDGLEYSKFSYLTYKVRQTWFPRVQIAFGEPFRVARQERETMRVQKERAADFIQERMRGHLLASRLKPEVNLFNETLAAARIHGSGSVICEDAVSGASYTYKQLLLAAYALSGLLGRLLRGERRAAVLLPNAAAHIIALLALFHRGITPAILNYSAGRQAMRDALETAGVSTVVTSRAFVDKAGLADFAAELESGFRVLYLEDARALLTLSDKLRTWFRFRAGSRGPEAGNEVILFTSGSESKPKGVVLAHGSLYANIQQARAVIAFNATDTVLGAMPMFHSFGLTAGTMLPILSGMKVVMYPNPLHYKVIPEIAYDRNVTILFGTSTFLAAYGRTAHPYDFAYSLKYVVAGAEKLKEEVRQLWMDKFGIRILEGYGTTETAPVISLNTPMHYKKGSVGRLLPGMDCRIEPVPGIERGGLLYVQGPNVMKGYLLHGKGFEPCPEWYCCGDVVDINEQGYMTIQARLQSFAKIGGEKISLPMVEEASAAVLPHTLCAAVAVPDARKGERIVVYHNNPHAQLSAVKEAMRLQGQPPLLLPSELRYMERLPLLGSGKVDYATLRTMAGQQAAEGEK